MLIYNCIRSKRFQKKIRSYDYAPYITLIANVLTKVFVYDDLSILLLPWFYTNKCMIHNEQTFLVDSWHEIRVRCVRVFYRSGCSINGAVRRLLRSIAGNGSRSANDDRWYKFSDKVRLHISAEPVNATQSLCRRIVCGNMLLEVFFSLKYLKRLCVRGWPFKNDILL